MAAAIASDIVYSLLLVAGLAHLGVRAPGELHCMAARCCWLAALLALVPFGRGFFRDQFAALARAARALWPIFRDLTRWSLLGVMLTELTVNAHAYLVTFISGPGSFALLALGMLLMRPASLVQSALPDLERPVMTRAIAASDIAGAGAHPAPIPLRPGGGLAGTMCCLRGAADLVPAAGAQERLWPARCDRW